MLKAFTNTIQKLIIPIVLLGSGSRIHAQNLVPNNSFDILTMCPGTFAGICLGYAPPWTCGNFASSDLFNSCSNPSWYGVPENVMGNQEAFTGDGYAGIICKWTSVNSREYVTTPLTAPLTTGSWYFVSFYVSLGEIGCGIEHIGAYFSAADPYIDIPGPMDVDPQIESSGSFLSDTENWILISGCFQAVGGEQFLTIGNFRDDGQTFLEPGCMVSYSYYYIDEVTVMEAEAPEEIFFDLAGPVFACYSYEIDPDLDDLLFEWSDGSTGPTLEVTMSGTYILTVTDGCNTGIDSIEVTIAGDYEPVDVGPDAVTFCSGDEYTISLDPTLFDYLWNDGSSEPVYTITSSGTYSVTLDNGCLETTDQITVEVIDPPAPFSLGDDLFLCIGDQFTLSLDPTLGDFIWQDNTTSPTFDVTEGGTYAVTVSNMCGMASDEILITEMDVPEVEIGPENQTICNGDFIDIIIDIDNATILWQDGSDLSDYQITEQGLYSVLVTNMCGSGSDEMEVTISDPPMADLGPDINLCNGDTIILTNPVIEGMYQWQDGSMLPTFQVTSSGVYSLLITNTCGDAFDEVLVNLTDDVVSPSLGPDVSLCPGEEAILFANNPNATNIVWQDNSTADSLLVNTSGTYYVTVSNSCSTASDTIEVTVNNSPPQIDLPDQLSLCQGQSILLDAVIAGVTYQWNDNSQNQQLLVTAAGVYSLTVTNSCGTDVDTTIVLDGGLAPAVALGNDLQLCSGDIIQLTPTFANVDTWLWQDGSNMSSYTVSNAGVITVAVNNSCGAAYDTLMVDLLPSTPPLDLGPDTSLCSSESLVLTINTPGVSILWADGSTDTYYTVDEAGTYYASISTTCGESSDTIQVTALPDIPVLNLGPDQSLCPGEIITVDPGIPDVIYEWHDGSNDNTYQSTEQETITLTITNNCGSSSDEMEIIENTEGPQVDLGDDIQVCEGIVVTIPSSISGVDYLWQDGSTDATFVTDQSGVFILNVSNNCGTDADTIAVDISGIAPNPFLGNDTTLCEGLTIVLTSMADAETSIAWQNGSSANEYIVSAPETIILNESNRCGDAADTVVVSYIDAPDPFNLGRDTTLCPGESIVLTAPTTAFNIQWQDGSTDIDFEVQMPGIYSLQLSNPCGSITDEIVVEFYDQVQVEEFEGVIGWCPGDTILLDASQPFPASYLWNTGDTAQAIQVNNIGYYFVEVSTTCQTIQHTYDVYQAIACIPNEEIGGIYIPNIFSPNDDQVNDLFSVSVGTGLQILDMEGSIFDRWGNLVYRSNLNPFIWDGRHQGEHVLPGVYVYLIECTLLVRGKEEEEIFSGNVTVVR